MTKKNLNLETNIDNKTNLERLPQFEQLNKPITSPRLSVR